MMNTASHYDVIVMGGGPVGIALALELGLNQVKTLVLEKHAEPLKMPRAQSLSARTMELFLRWGADETLMAESLLPLSLPQTGIWCSTLCGESFFETAWGDNQLKEQASPKAGVRVPIWITEQVLRDRLAELPTVDLLLEHEVIDIVEEEKQIQLKVYDRQGESTKSFSCDYLTCCDGVGGISKQIFNNNYQPLSDATLMLGTLFISKTLWDQKTVPDGIMYFVLREGALAFVGPVDLDEGLWLAQIVWPKDKPLPDEAALSEMIDTIVGQSIDKSIVDFYSWDMQVQIADFFNKDNRIFWLGDAAHAFAPTGGLGLNTGFGDSYNLGWKLAEVIQKKAPLALLESYAKERYPVWQANLDFARNNAKEFLEIKNQFPPEKDYQAYTRAYADLASRYLHSSGLTLGYAYLDSAFIRLLPQQSREHNPFEYTPKLEPGYFLPHIEYRGETIYRQLSARQWNLLISAAPDLDMAAVVSLAEEAGLRDLHILLLDEDSYPYPWVLLRPDWHIAQLANDLSELAAFY